MPSPFDRLMDTIRPRLPGAMDRAIKQELFLVCFEFFKNSNTWRETIQFTIPAGDKSDTVVPAAGRVNNLLYVKDANDLYVSGFFMTNPGVVERRYTNTVDETYDGTFGITVQDPADVDSFPIAPAQLVERYTDELIDGICSRMMAQMSKPYTNSGLAQYHLTRYRGGTFRARNDMNEGNTYGSQAWAFPQTFRVSRS